MPRISQITAGLASLVLIGGVATTANAAPPEPSTSTAAMSPASGPCHGYQVDAGPKLRASAGFRTEFLGAIAAPDGSCGVCPDYGDAGPDGRRWSAGDLTWIKDRKVRAQVAWLANGYWDDVKDGTGKVIRLGSVHSNRTAAAQKVAENRLLWPAFRYDWEHSYRAQVRKLDAGVGPLADQMLAAANAAGDVKTTVTLTSKPEPGGTGVVVVKALGNGRPLSAQPVRWTVQNATVTSSEALTDAAGTATLRLIWDGSKPLDVKATVESPDWRKVEYLNPSSGKIQHLVRGTFTVTSSAKLRYDALLGVTVEQACGTTCNGKPPVTMTAEAGAKETTWQALIGGKPVTTLVVPAGKTATALVKGATDGGRISPRYRVGKGAWRTVKTTFEVICPPWPTITVQKTCVCKGTGSITYKVTYPGGIRADVVRFTVNGVTETRNLTGTETFTAPLASGTTVSLGFSAYDHPGGTELTNGVMDAFTQN